MKVLGNSDGRESYGDKLLFHMCNVYTRDFSDESSKQEMQRY